MARNKATADNQERDLDRFSKEVSIVLSIN